MRLLLCALLISLALPGSHLQKVDYSNYRIVKSVDGSDLLKNLDIPNKYERFEAVTEDRSSILLDPSSAEALLSLLRAANVPYSIVTENLQKDIDNEVSSSSNWFYSYHRFEDLLNWLQYKQKLYPSELELIDIGMSYQKRPLRVLKMTGKKNQCGHKPAIWIDSGIHAREWISHTTSTFIIDKMLLGYRTDAEVRELRDTYDWYFLVTMNPDGYVHSWDNDRLWRKSMKPVNYSTCLGTDTNRNFDHQWGTIGISSNPCDQTFAGPRAYSDPEAKAVADFIIAKEGHWDVFLTIHSYGHLLLAPWGYTKEVPENYHDLHYTLCPALNAQSIVGNATVKAIKEVHGLNYRFGTSANILYQSSGTSRDWAKGVAKIPYVYTFELRSGHSFILPPSEIIPTGEEIWAGVMALVKTVKTITPPKCK